VGEAGQARHRGLKSSAAGRAREAAPPEAVDSKPTRQAAARARSEEARGPGRGENSLRNRAAQHQVFGGKGTPQASGVFQVSANRKNYQGLVNKEREEGEEGAEKRSPGVRSGYPLEHQARIARRDCLDPAEKDHPDESAAEADPRQSRQNPAVEGTGPDEQGQGAPTPP